MAKPLDPSVSQNKKKSSSPTTILGVSGTPIYGGVIDNQETSALLSGDRKYKTYSDILANVSIVSAGVRYFLNLVAKASWYFKPSEADTDGTYAKRLEQMLTKDPETSWPRIIRRAAMYRFYGFSIQEWTAKKADDGVITIQDVAPRPQKTITKWDVDIKGKVLGIIQESPQDFTEIYIPRQKVMYLVDDSLNDSPEGLGLFRHLVSPSQRLKRYEQLEGFGFETDLRGIPIGRGPFTELQKMVENGEITPEQRNALEKPLRDFIERHIRSEKLGMLLDSITYETQDEANRPSNISQWSIELLKGSSNSFAENAMAIERLNRELARILNVEHLLLGSESGAYALSRDKTDNLFLLIDSALAEIVEGVKRDLVPSMWQLNGWDEKYVPDIGTEAVRHAEIEQITTAISDMATAGAVLDNEDPVIDEIRELMGLSSRPKELIAKIVRNAEIDAAIGPAIPEIVSGEDIDG